ncbi:hypothetical protein B484DRAFT_402212, partial [Ochromonadaceae sp. CCMP2298]
KKAMLHHYTEYVDASVVAEAEGFTATLLEEYATLERSGSVAASRAGPTQGAPASFLDAAAASRPVQLFPAF